jgi:hypothetical protein
MRKLLLALSLALFAGTAAEATGGLVCRTAGQRPVEVSVGFGHVPGAPLILTRLIDDGREVPAKSSQWWLDNSEVRLLLIDPDARDEVLTLKARRSGHVYDGSLWRSGQRRWVRCRED